MTRLARIGECMVELVERPDGVLSRGLGGDTLNTAVCLVRLGVKVDYARRSAPTRSARKCCSPGNRRGSARA